MRFHDPQLLLLLPLMVLFFLAIRRAEHRRGVHPFSGTQTLGPLPGTLRTRLARIVPYLRLPALLLLMLALARPQAVLRETTAKSRGADLVLALDLSTSMLAEELGRQGRGENRLAMAKGVIRDFVKGRSGDRISLVAFAARPYPAAPLTLDHDWLLGAIDRLQVGAVEDGTALGDALLAAVNRIRNRPALSRAVILVTDGRNNAGSVSPSLAAAAAGALGVRVHAIGIGSHGAAVLPVPSPLGGTAYRQVDADLDEATLRQVAAATGGSFFRADDRQVLARVFREIDLLEKSPVDERLFFSYRELYPPLVLAALLFFLAEVVLRLTLLRRFP